MKKTTLLVIVSALFLCSCGSSKKVIVPLSKILELNNTYTIIWNGVSKAFHYENGEWQRAERYDYQFSVVQKRYNNHWKSIKTLHRVHPDYKGGAGHRNQTMYFDVVYDSMTDGKVQAKITSTLGNGTGTTDVEFRNSELVMYVPNASPFMPYNKIKINQQYKYEEGMLMETVELVKEKNGKETPFFRNEETAMIYVNSRLDKAPTRYQP